MMHHDTITGTSPGHVIQAASDKAETVLLQNSISLVEIMQEKAKSKGLIIDGLNQCIQKVNDKSLCPIFMSPPPLSNHLNSEFLISKNQERIILVHNPSIADLSFIIL